MKEIENILNDGNIEEMIRKVKALSDLLVSASITSDLPTHESVNWIALEILTAAEAIQGIYNDLLKATEEADQAIA